MIGIKVKEVIVAATNEEVINGRGSFFNYVGKTRYVGCTGNVKDRQIFLYNKRDSFTNVKQG